MKNTSRFVGIRIHDPKGPRLTAPSIGALTNSAQDKAAAEEAKITDPSAGGDLPQDELRRFGQ